MSGASDDPEVPRRPFDLSEAPTFRCPSCGAPAAAEARACVHCGSLLATRRCLGCFALSPREAERCLRCGALLPREALRSGPPGKCPDCRLDLVSSAVGAVGYLECPRCSGLFLRKDSFDAVTADAETRSRVRVVDPVVVRKPGEPLPPVKYRSCPVCGRLMNRQNYGGGSGIIVDTCVADGFWLDRGELTAIVDFLEKGGWERVKKRERERLEEDVRRLESKARMERSGMPTSHAEMEVKGVQVIADVLGFIGGLLRR